jgi:hypothetical protein
MSAPNAPPLPLVLAGLSWAVVGVIKLLLVPTHAHWEPPTYSVLAAQIAVVVGGALCCLAIFVSLQRLQQRRPKLPLFSALIAAGAYLVWWLPAGAEGIARRLSGGV